MIIDDISRSNNRAPYADYNRKTNKKEPYRDASKNSSKQKWKDEISGHRSQPKHEEKNNSVAQLRSYNDYKSYTKKNRKCIVFYGANWCNACNNISGLYKRIADKYGHLVGFAYADIDDAGLDFTHVPVFIASVDGKPIGRLDGTNRDSLKELIKTLITSK